MQLLRAAKTFHSKAYCWVRNVRSKCEEDSQVRVRGLVSYIPKTKGKLLFQQDGTTAHAPQNSVSAQREIFSWHCGLFQRWCGMASLITQLNHQIWAYVTSFYVVISIEKVFKHCPQILPELKRLDYWRSESHMCNQAIQIFKKTFSTVCWCWQLPSLWAIFLKHYEYKMLCIINTNHQFIQIPQ